MQQNTDGQGRQLWTRRALAALAVVLLMAVPVFALTTLAPDTFASLPASGDGTKTADVSAAPLTFDAPAVSLRQARPVDSEGSEAPGVLTDWTFTNKDKDKDKDKNTCTPYH